MMTWDAGRDEPGVATDAYANAFRFVHALRSYGAVLSLADDGQVCCDVCGVAFADAEGEQVLRMLFHTMHDVIAFVLRDEERTHTQH